MDNVTICRDTFRQVEGPWLLISSAVIRLEARTDGKSIARNHP
jgi:hypothetical protein